MFLGGNGIGHFRILIGVLDIRGFVLHRALGGFQKAPWFGPLELFVFGCLGLRRVRQRR